MFRSKYLLICLFLCFGCGTSKKAYFDNTYREESQNSSEPKNPVYSLYLIGDTGASESGKENAVLLDLEQKLKTESENSAVVFLGDQIYPDGMPKSKSKRRVSAESVLEEQLKILKDYKGKAYFIAGERDWNNEDPKGLKALKRQEEFIESYFDEKKKARFYPSDGCGDPKVVKVDKKTVLVFLNTQWWLQDWSEEKKMNKGCDIRSRYDLLNTMEEIFYEYKNKEIVVLMHHPIKSNGYHGGKFSIGDHIFPFKKSNNLGIPLPVIGSLVPISRNISGSKQDISNADYKALMGELNNLAKSLRIHVIFASAHDNGLQHFDGGKLQYIVSGSGSKTEYIAKSNGAKFAYSALGYCKISFYEEFESWLEVFAKDSDNSDFSQVYKTQLRAARPGTIEDEIKFPPLTDSEISLPANANFAAGSFKKAFLGTQYRDMWSTPVTVPIIDLEKELGGLTPIKKGGGLSSNSLRMEKSDGKQYILRSINKDYRKLLPPDFVNLKLIDLMKDQNSASHPYGALIIPHLSKAAGIYYTTPKLVYLKHQRGLGNYNSQFPEELYLLEERPSGNWADAAQFGNAKEIISYADLLNILVEQKNHFVDQHWVVRSRMFDLLIHDWDRHDDQWRWAVFEEEGKTLYRPIPRDRDQAFYKFVGVIPSYVAAFMMKKFKTMKDDVKDVKNLSFNAKHFDRYFTNELAWSDWEKQIKSLQSGITDDVIRESMNALPEEVVHLNDEELIRKLISRRNNLLDIGRKLYEFLSEEVEIIGTNDKNRFEVLRNDDGSVLLQVYVERKKKDDLLKYERLFFPSETKEIRLYGLRGKDEFNISGSNDPKIKIRIIGGEDDDEVFNLTNGAKIYVYDELKGIKLKGEGMKDMRSDDLEVNEYDRQGFKYNTNFPIISFGNTVDDGFWFGGAYSWTMHSWRKNPYKARQSFSFSFAPGSQDAVQFSYQGHFPESIGKLDFAPQLDLNFPRYENYFGLGNETFNPLREIQYHWVRMQSFEVDGLLQLRSDNNRTLFEFGPSFQSIDVKNTEGRVSEDEILGFDESVFDRRQFLGAQLNFQTGFVRHRIFPTSGFLFNANSSYYRNLSDGDQVIDIDTDLRFYINVLNKPQVVLANALGYNKIFGDPQFYQLADLGNNTNLRGFRNNRFRGESAFYHNIDLRMQLFNWNNNVLPMQIGVLGGFDYGRVWINNEESSKWHNSKTIGLWMEILGALVVQPYYSLNSEQNTFSLILGFQF